MVRLRWMAAAVLGVCALTARAEVSDDFSGNDWQLMSSTPGKLNAAAGSLTLTDKPGGVGWVTAMKTFEVDLNADPILSLKVKTLSKGGEVKLLRQKPDEKHAVLHFGSPGVYNFNVREKLGWKGKVRLTVCLYSSGEGSSIAYEYLKFTARPAPATVDKAETKAVRPVAEVRPGFELVPLFVSCGYCWTAPKQGAVDVFFRKKGAEWLKGEAPVRVEEDNMYRGSVVGLDENSDYELKLVDAGGKTLITGAFRTWNSQVPVAKTVVLNADNFRGNLKIVDQGRADGWIRYVAAPGFVLKNDGKTALLELRGAKYVLLEGLKLQGGERNAMVIDGCSQVRVGNCEISGWGRVGVQRFDRDGKYYDATGRAINYDGAILLRRSYGAVVERCYIHDPRNTANSWRYSHPAGPEALMIEKPEATVLRYNDFIGSDAHRWNDAVEGVGNFEKDGGFNRDADIYGNMMAFASDDCIELDGGQWNVRCFMNKFEGALCGVSIQGCMAGPSYVFRNLIVNMGDEFGLAGQSIKTSSPGSGKDAVSYVLNNTMHGNGSGLALLSHLKVAARNNVFSGGLKLTGQEKSLRSVCTDNLIVPEAPFVDRQAGLFALRQGATANVGAFPAGAAVSLPFRPIPVELDRSQLNFTVAAGKASAPQTVTATVGGGNFSALYEVRQNLVTDWFTVSPSSGVLKSGDKVVFNVKLNPERMKSQRSYRGVFLVRLENGYSRPVTVYAQTDLAALEKPTRAGVFTAYVDLKQPSGGKTYPVIDDPGAEGGKAVSMDGERRQNPALYTIDVPADGKYFLLLRARSAEPVGEHDSVCMGLDGGPLLDVNLGSGCRWGWVMAAIGGKPLERLKANELKKGRHTVAIAPRESIYLDLLAVTSDPGIFEQR